MTASELEVEFHKVDGKFKTELLALAAEDRVLGAQFKAAGDKIDATITAQRETDRKIESILTELASLREAVTQLKSDREKWSGRMWGLSTTALAAVFGAVLTAGVTALLALAGFKRP